MNTDDFKHSLYTSIKKRINVLFEILFKLVFWCYVTLCLYEQGQILKKILK